MLNGILKFSHQRMHPEQLFVLSAIMVNAGNYFYNLILGRYLGPKEFADASVLITMLLILSFAAMTFQLIAAKFVVQFEKEVFSAFAMKLKKYALALGVVLCTILLIGATWLEKLLNTSSSHMFIVFGVGIPVYFYLSVQRGIVHGKEQYIQLSLTYQMEMIGRLLVTFILLMLLPLNSAVIVAWGVLLSLIAGVLPIRPNGIRKTSDLRLNRTQGLMVRNFILVTLIYECSQILINNSDILLVKHYFSAVEAGLYASLALIGRAVYFITWMFIMLLLPKVIEAKKKGKDTTKLLLQNIRNTVVLCGLIVVLTVSFPETIIYLLFGNEYLEIANLLWKYALATSFFAVSNIFSYYYLSLERYFAVLLSALFGILQIAFIIRFHQSLNEVVGVQIILMFTLLIAQMIHFILRTKKDKIIHSSKLNDALT